MAQTNIVFMIIELILLLLAAGYLLWWGIRFYHGRKARTLATKVSSQAGLSEHELEQNLEYARLLSPQSPEYARVCIALAQHETEDPRAIHLFERYLATQRVSSENVVVARRWAYLTLKKPLSQVSIPEGMNAAALLDQINQAGVATPEDIEKRADFATQWTDITPTAIATTFRVWQEKKNTPEGEALTHFLYNYFETAWISRSELVSAVSGSPATEQTLADFDTRAAEVFCYQAHIPRTSLETYLLAIQATYAIRDYLACFKQCEKTRQDFGTAKWQDWVWQTWGQCIVQLEKEDWVSFSQRHFAHLPTTATPGRLQEILDKACALNPEDVDLLRAQAWTYLGANIPMARAQPVYERVYAQNAQVVPALEKLADHYYQTHAWEDLKRISYALIPLQEHATLQGTQRRLAEAIIKGSLPADIPLFEVVFDLDPTYQALNEQLARYYNGLPDLGPHELAYTARVLESSLPPSFKTEQQQALRAKYILTWIRSTEKLPESVPTQVTKYLDAGGAKAEIMKWAADHQLGRQDTLEALMRQPPVKRVYCIELANRYKATQPSEDQMKLLVEAVESIWEEKSVFDKEDTDLAAFVGLKALLAPETRKKLILALLRDHPEGWRETAGHYLAEALQKGQADADLLQNVLSRLYTANDTDPVHVWALEALANLPGRDEPIADGLRLLALYDAGVGCPEEGADAVQEKAEKLSEELSRRCRKARPQLQGELFPDLLNRLLNKDVNKLASWEIDLFLLGIKENLLSSKPRHQRYAGQLVTYLLEKKSKDALKIQDWLHDNSKQTPADAARLFEVAHTLDKIPTEDDFWFGIASQARSEERMEKPACEYLTEDLLARKTWDKEHIHIAADLLKPPYRQRLAPAFIERVAYRLEGKLDKKLVDLINEDIILGEGRAELLLALVERREKKRDYDGALDACFLIEESVGPSEELTRKILALLPNSAYRIQCAQRLNDYMERYPNSVDILAQMVTLARDVTRPLDFGLAFRIMDKWGDMVVKPGVQAEFASDPSFVAASKCEVYDLFREEMTPSEAQKMLSSIAKHSRQALSEEARRRIERIGDEVLFSSGQDEATRLIVAGILYGLGNLAAATSHYEHLAEIPEQHQVAIDALGSIARQLETPRREIPALLVAYRRVSEDNYKLGHLDLAEATVKKAKTILLDQSALENLTEDGRKRVMTQQDAILKLYQSILEARQEKGRLTIEQTRDLADVYRLRGLWDKAGMYFSELALLQQKNDDRNGALENAELVFDCYYKAGKSWWGPAGRYLLRILWGRETIPTDEYASRFNTREFRLLESVAAMYHSMYVDPNLHLDGVTRLTYKQNAQLLYDRLSFNYLQQNAYVRTLMDDLRQKTPQYLEPFELIPHIHERGRGEMWTSVRYEKIDYLGGGEFADVYKVKDSQTGQFYAMKQIKPAYGRDPKTVERFLREGSILKELDHPNIVKCHDVGVQEDRPFIIMDFVDGSTLDDLINTRRRSIPIKVLLRIFLNICSAVEFSHNQGLLHRDLHPGNVLVGGREYEEVKLSDFGLATMMDREGVGKSSRIHGRENYTPPEVYAGGKETPSSELYSLGAILCFILEGYPHPDATLLRRLKLPENYSLGEVIERALANEPANRYQRVTELIQEVRQHAEIAYDYGAILQKVTPYRFQQMFKLAEELGKGVAGTVYSAHDLRVPEAADVAIKEIASDRVSGSLERRAEHFFRVRDLSHPNIVPLQSFFRVNGKLYIVMDLVKGQSLANVIDTNATENKRFTPQTILKVVTDVAQGLAFVHEHGIVHGCVVPTNILLESKNQQARLSDFTAAVLFDGDQLHKSAMIRQYNYYLAPETSRNEPVSPSSDVYSLGWLLCHMITGRRGQLSSNEIFAAMEETSQWKEKHMDLVVQIIEGSTALDPSQRAYADAGKFLEEVGKVKS